MKKHFITFIIGLVIFGIGCGYIGFELMSYDFVDTYNKKDFNLTTKEYQYEVNDKTYNFYYDNGNVKNIIDEEVDNIRVTVEYDIDLFTIERQINKNESSEDIYYSFSYKHKNYNIDKMIKLFKKCVKNKTVYDFSEIFNPTIIVITNSENSKYVNINNDYFDYDDDMNFDFNN